MREINQAYKATVVLIALLDTLWTNTNALSKVLRDGVHTQLAKKFRQQHDAALRLQAEVRAVAAGENDPSEEEYIYAKSVLRAARKMNREARAVARYFDIPVKDMYASELVRRMG
tara:strand:- start:476 stop:820 length:345 start_codon:yes stop_codon:yes gene_type:complete